jgi:uncharacterized membrane protein YozB (DUF420 family)
MFLGSRLITLSDISLLIQVLAFFLLLYALYKKNESIVNHGKIAKIAFYLALPSVVYMLYKRSQGFNLPDYNLLLNLHIFLGILTIILGVLFVSNQWKWKGKKYMDLEIVFWIGSFLLGISIYYLIF